jgi:Universal stress protein family
MFGKILHANDGSEHAFRALALALAIAKQNRSELHIVCVEEISFLPEFMEEVRESTGTAARYFHGVLRRARSMAEESQVHLDTHVLAGHPVRDIVKLAADIGAVDRSDWHRCRPSSPRKLPSFHRGAIIQHSSDREASYVMTRVYHLSRQRDGVAACGADAAGGQRNRHLSSSRARSCFAVRR